MIPLFDVSVPHSVSVHICLTTYEFTFSHRYSVPLSSFPHCRFNWLVLVYCGSLLLYKLSRSLSRLGLVREPFATSCAHSFHEFRSTFLHLNSPHLAHARTLSHFSHWVTQAITTVRSSWVGQFITTNNRILS